MIEYITSTETTEKAEILRVHKMINTVTFIVILNKFQADFEFIVLYSS